MNNYLMLGLGLLGLLIGVFGLILHFNMHKDK